MSTATSKPVTQAGSLPVPPDGPKTITEFPIPAGAKIFEIGAYSGDWNFAIGSPDPATVLQFYRATFAAKGYMVEEHRKLQVGKNTLDLDLYFSGPGPIYGFVNEESVSRSTSVKVNSKPIVNS